MLLSGDLQAAVAFSAHNVGDISPTDAATSLTVSGVTANDKTYDGTTVATLNLGSVVLVGLANGDNVTLDTDSATAAFASKNVAPG